MTSLNDFGKGILAANMPNLFSRRSSFLAWQQRQLLRHLRWLRRHSKYWEPRLDGDALERWRTADVISKSEMVSHFDTMNTRGLSWDDCMNRAINAEQRRAFTSDDSQLGDCAVGLSSGTSGSRGLFVTDAKERAVWAGYILTRMLPAAFVPTRNERIAFFLRANSALYQSVSSRRVQFDYFDLIEPLAALMVRLEMLEPTVLVAPPSVLRYVALQKAAGKISIAPHKVISVAEVLEPVDAGIIKEQFNVPIIHQVYQATEGLLATTCQYGVLHLAEENIMIEPEYLDSGRKRFVPVITDFRRRVQPVVKYRLNDVLIRKESCRCGRVTMPIEAVEGRMDDVFYFQPAYRSHESFRPVFPDFVRRAILMASGHIRAYRVVQVAPDAIEVALEIDEANRQRAEREVRRELAQLWDRLHVRSPQLRIVPSVAPRDHDKKHKRIQRNCPIDGV